MRFKFLVFLMLLPFPAWSADFDFEVCAIQATNDTAFIRSCSNYTSYNQCASGDWVVWPLQEGKGEAMYSTALTAFSLGKKVQVRVDGKTCIGMYDVTSMIRIVK
ncbi:hypothetical protein [Microbulbifer sp. TRSA005]|uniref:hypothetical protein n=1 Tax=unclassified Microbulbifer TaxID=2619833 RepID=UPI00403A0141